MFDINSFYLALGRDKDPKVVDNWSIVKYIGNDQFKLAGSTHTYGTDSFDRIITVSAMSAYRSHKKLQDIYRGKIQMPKPPKDAVEELLAELRSLKDDLDGNISLSSYEQDNKVRKIFRLVDKIDSRNMDESIEQISDCNSGEDA